VGLKCSAQDIELHSRNRTIRQELVILSSGSLSCLEEENRDCSKQKKYTQALLSAVYDIQVAHVYFKNCSPYERGLGIYFIAG
jgi:hypothetical protein